MWPRIRFWFGVFLLFMFALMALSAVLLVGDGSSDWVITLVVGVIVFGLPGFLLAFPRQARLVPWAGLTGIGLGALLIFLGYLAWQSDQSFLENAQDTVAVATADAVEECDSSAEGVVTTCLWRGPFVYVVDGVEYSAMGITPQGAVAGDEFPIRYHLDNPADWRAVVVDMTTVGGVEVPSGDWWYWVLPVLGLGILVAGLFGFQYQIRNRRRE